jgi:hypothetical protein
MGNQQISAADDGAVNVNDTEPPAIVNLAAEASRPDVDECDLCCDALPGYVCGDLRVIDKQSIICFPSSNRNSVRQSRPRHSPSVPASARCTEPWIVRSVPC